MKIKNLPESIKVIFVQQKTIKMCICLPKEKKPFRAVFIDIINIGWCHKSFIEPSDHEKRPDNIHRWTE